MNDKKYIAISIKHTMHLKKGCWCLWDYNHSGYVDTAEKAGLYTPEEMKGEFWNFPVVKMCKDLLKRYKNIDTVLVDKDEFIAFISDKRSLDDLLCENKILHETIEFLKNSLLAGNHYLILPYDAYAELEKLVPTTCERTENAKYIKRKNNLSTVL